MCRSRFPLARATVLLLCVVAVAPINHAYAATYSVLYEFTGINSDGCFPGATLTFDAVGNLYGTTSNCGSGVFRLSPNPDGTWTETSLYLFDSREIDGSVILDAAGNLYGSVINGGVLYRGIVFKLTPNSDGSWTETTIYNFSGPDGNGPVGALVFDPKGNMYGTTDWGGAYGFGVVFQLAPNPDGSWTETVLHNFAGGTAGGEPLGSLVFDSSGSLYGTASSVYPEYATGAAFKVSPNPDGTWSETLLHSFKGPDGANPTSNVVFDAAGNMYFPTMSGGKYNNGTIVKMSPLPGGTWKGSLIHQFTGGQDGANPMGALAIDAAGNLFGSTNTGGALKSGTLFEMSPVGAGWKFKLLYHFANHQGAPGGGLVLDAAGNLYGTTRLGGANGVGLAFKFTP